MPRVGRVGDEAAQLFVAGRLEEDADRRPDRPRHEQSVDAFVEGDPLQGHRDEPQQKALESVDHAQSVERLVSSPRALHDEDVTRVLFRAALTTRQVERQTKPPERDEGEDDEAVGAGCRRWRLGLLAYPSCTTARLSR